ncbi:taurine ABC transporter substrate-binding protein [Bifidobacterium eulemuris]|uniref:Glycine/betaine ABC transporter substrate-binding protein n=2 Tax=Bifidobacterium eulemuris TaxID=1765219 RepID=A0A261GE20_9BIFI|nr:ABC transporter substrate-binding protein [Bifidobacterium eulemuris]OZG69660.1 glycine/betaine ABC transporter substrate-binding protein [Bifidobacterium eulemuris]
MRLAFHTTASIRRIRRASAALAGGAMLTALAACGSMPTAYELAGVDPNGTADVGCPVDADNDFTGTIRIAWQAIPNADLIVKDMGLLEACLPQATIEWNQFNSGGDVVQAFGSRSIDIGLMGSSPAVRSVSAPLDLPVAIVWIHDIIGDAESLVANDDSITQVADLKGANIAVPFGSTSHFSLLSALADAGLSETDVHLINLDPDKMAAAWTRGEIDAAWVWDPVLSTLRADGGHIVTSSAQTALTGAATYDMEVASEEFITDNPDVMRIWTAVEDYAAGLISEDPDGSAEMISSQLGNDPDDVAAQLEGYTYPRAAEQSELFHGDLPGTLKDTAEFLKTQNSLDAVNDDYADALYTDAIDAVAGE